MKYLCIFFILFALINSKQELKLKSLLENTMDTLVDDASFSDCSDIRGDEATCKAATPLLDNFQCCHLEIVTDDYVQDSQCMPLPLGIEVIEELKSLNQFNAVVKESFGFVNYNYEKVDDEMLNAKVNIKCPKKDMTFTPPQYTENEISILKNEKHCLNYFVNSFQNMLEPVKCENGLLLDSSKEAGLECGYITFSVKLKTDQITVPSFQTCFLFNLEFYSKIVNSDLGEGLKKISKETINQLIGKYAPKEAKYFLDSYSIEFRNAKGDKVIYDSSVDDYHVLPTKGFLLSISKYLFLFIFLLF